MARHLSLKKYTRLRFGLVEHDSLPPTDATHDAFLFLEYILADPEIASYPTKMVLGGLHNRNDPETDTEVEIYNRRLSFINDHFNELQDRIENSTIFPEEDKQDAVIAISDPNNEAIAVGLLLTMLPNLRWIATEAWAYVSDFTWVGKIVQSIAKASRGLESVTTTHPLDKLRCFSMSHTINVPAEHMDWCGSFAMLPSMRILNGATVESRTFKWPSSFLSEQSNVAEIYFTNSYISVYAFRSLLSGFANLERFTYHHNTRHRYDPGGLVEVLRSYAATTLQLLDVCIDLSMHHSKSFSFAYEGRRFIGPLQMFTSLNIIRLEDLTMVKPMDDDFVSELSSDGKVDKVKSLSRRILPLVDMLPGSVEHLTVIVTIPGQSILRLLRGMAELKVEKLPNLKALRFEGINTLGEGILSSLRQVGLTVEFWSVDEVLDFRFQERCKTLYIW
ncbi:MAG: hypothetical protein Q9219_006995 [cf. Caloplaca sp. 3 TL-2023]